MRPPPRCTRYLAYYRGRAAMVLAIATAISACQSVRDDAFRKKLDGIVGMPFSMSGYSHPTDSIVISSTNVERTHQLKWNNGCTFQLDVDEATTSVLRWRLVSEEAPCQAAMHRALGS